MLSRRLLLRLAARLQSAFSGKPPPDPDDRDWEMLETRLNWLKTARHRWQLAHDHRLPLMLPGVRSEVRTALDDLGRHVERLRLRFEESAGGNDDTELSLSHWFAELRQLDEEFGGLTVDRKAGTLAVTTDPITLNDVPLGRFSLVFTGSRVGTVSGIRCFDVIALDPNPAQGKDSTTHPHVRDEELCVGDAARPLEDAVRDGRLTDAFLLIRSVLTTYNPKSPYVSLDDWDGRSCGECGGSVDGDDSSCCDACLTTLCDSCLSSCSGCSDYRCGECLQSCDHCHDRYCPGCLESIDRKSLCPSCIGTCAECQTRVPQEDLSPDSKLCPSCFETQETDDDSDSELTTPLGADSDSDRIGSTTTKPLLPLEAVA